MSPTIDTLVTIGAPYTLIAVAAVHVWRLHRRVAAARFAAVHDPLTGVYNRRILHSAIGEHLHTGAAFAVAILDVDRFKDVNDCYGHPAGDAVLVEITRRLTMAADGISHLIRLGGDEFALIITGDDDHAIAVAKTAWQLIAADPFTVAGLPDRAIDINVSIGVASHTLGTDPSSLLRQADAALAQAKTAGSVQHWHPTTSARALDPRPHTRRPHTSHYTLDATVSSDATIAPPWRCWFDAADIAPLADHAATSRHHRRTGAEDALIQDCPGGLEVIAEAGYVTAYSTGWPEPLRAAHDPDSVIYAIATATDGLRVPARPHLPQLAHLHLDVGDVDTIHTAADWGGLLEVTVTAEDATFTVTRRTTAGR